MLAATRRRVVVPRPDVIEIVRETVPTAASGEAIVRMVNSGVCGSDKTGIKGVHAFFAPPYYPGHEVVGVVEAVAPGVTAVAVGDRVIVEPTMPCGHCKPCSHGRENLCENMQFFGCGWNEGGMADYFPMPADRLHLIPDSISDLAAALIEPLATPLHAARLAGELADQSVVIIGAGTIGLLLLVIVKRQRPRRVIVVDPLESKRTLALHLGADEAIDARTDALSDVVRERLGESADVVFDCVAYESTIADAVRLASKGGTVVVIGGARVPVSVDLPVIQEFEIRVQGSITYTRTDFVDAIALVDSGIIDPTDFITATYPLSEAQKAFSPESFDNQVKVLVVADDDSEVSA